MLDLLPGSLLSVASMYLWGLLVATYFWRNSTLIHRIIIAFPVGYGTWGTIWVGTKLACHLFACSLAPGPEITRLATLLYLAVAIMLAVFVLSGKMINKAGWLTILGGATVLLALSTFYFFISYAILTPDSFSSVNWARDVPLALKDGYPPINLANANLSTLIGADYYLYIVHPLLAISLLLLIAGSVLGRKIGSPGLGLSIAWVVTIMGVLLVFSSNWMFGMQTFYVNHHMLTAINFLIIALLLFERDNLDTYAVIFVAILSVVISLSRMEGFLFVVLALAIFVFLLPNQRARTRLVGVVLVFSLPYLTYMITTLPAGSFVDGRQYAVMLVAAIALHFTLRLNLHGRYCNQETVGPIVVLGLVAILMLMILIKPTHMLESLMTFKTNLLVYEDWGASILLVLVATPCLWIYRVFTRGFFFRHDAFFYFFASALVLIVILTFFRNPLGYHAYDSANRMVFHFLPLAYVWIGLEISRILQIDGCEAENPTSI